MATWARCCLRDETKCFAFLAGHESFAAAEGAIGIAQYRPTSARKEPLRVILNGLGKDAAADYQPESTASPMCRPSSITTPAS